MRVRLRILHGKLQSKKGGSAGQEVEVRGPKFVIGSAEDCSMRCPSTAVSPHHCELYIRPREVVIRDLGSETGVRINEQRVEHENALQTGDHLRIGRLEFEVLIEATTAAETGQAEEDEAEGGTVSQEIIDSLIEADEKDRQHRKEDPESREFHLQEKLAEAAKHRPARPDQEEPEEEDAKKRGKKKPGKFTPPPPPPPPENTEEAAQEALRKLFEP